MNKDDNMKDDSMKKLSEAELGAAGCIDVQTSAWIMASAPIFSFSHQQFGSNPHPYRREDSRRNSDQSRNTLARAL
jgi:hypothetical protein